MQVSDKETRAVFLNFKEMRCLEKSVQVLDLEEAYSVSLINLEQKVMKVRDKKRRDRVNKIKSHLSMDDIEEMKMLEAQGKLGVKESSSKLNFNIRIDAAEKRLKLNGRAKSAVPRLEGSKSRPVSRMTSQRSPRTPLPSSRDKTPVPVINEPDPAMSDYPCPRSVREERRNSISIAERPIKLRVPKIAFDESSDSDNAKSPTGTPKSQRGSSRMSQTLGEETKFFLDVPGASGAVPKFPSSSKVRPVSVPATQISNFAVPPKRRPSTSNPRAEEMRRKSVADIRQASRLIKSGKTKMPFSAHEARRPKKSQLQTPYRSIRDGAMSEANLDSRDNDIGNDLFHQIKQGMIFGEMATSLHIEEQIDNFFEELDKYKKDNPTHFEPTDFAAVLAEREKAKREKPKKKRNETRRRQLERQLQDIEARKQLADQMWANMDKCRYLRLEDDRLDTSGVNTLAVDQMRQLRSIHASID